MFGMFGSVARLFFGTIFVGAVYAAAHYPLMQLHFEPYHEGFIATDHGETFVVSGPKLEFGGTLELVFIGNRCPCAAEALELQPGTTSYFIGGHPSLWRTRVPHYRRVRYRNVYSGIDLIYRVNGQQLEFDLALSRGADEKKMAMRFRGARGFRVDESGDLVVQTARGALRLHRPSAYYEEQGEPRAIGARYAIRGSLVAVVISGHDRTKPLIVDPMLTYSTYVGDANRAKVSKISVDAAGNTYVVGSRVLGVPGSLGRTESSSDVLVAKLDAGGNIVFTTYLGGKGVDEGLALAVDTSGNAYVAGRTTSPNFPVRRALQARPRGAFLTKISPDGTTLLYSTYFGGAGRLEANSINAIALDGAGNAYVTGETDDFAFPVTPGAFQTKPFLFPFLSQPPLASTAFVSKISATGDVIVYSTFLGGSRTLCSGGSSCLNFQKFDRGRAIAVDASGGAYIAGVTSSADFPTTPGAVQTEAAGITPFVAKLNATGTALLYSSYLGGSSIRNSGGMIVGGGDDVSAIAVDGSGSAFLIGKTANASFPTTPGALQTKFGGPLVPQLPFELPPTDAFISKLSPAGSTLSYSTYLGGSGADQALGLALDSQGNVYITGTTASSQFPSTDNSFPPGSAFLTKLNATGSTALYSARFPDGFSGKDVALDASGRLHLAGPPGIISVLDLSMASRPAVLSIANAAGNAIPGSVAPGELISIFGIGIGPDKPVGLTLDPSGFVSKTLADAEVFFDGVPAPLLYVSDKQVNAIAPYGIAGKIDTRVRVVFKTTPTSDFRLAVVPAAPEIFRNPDGSAAALNSDGTVNFPTNPAKLGSVVAIYGTGAGELTPPAVDGELSSRLATPNLPVSIEVASIPTDVLYAGAAPSLVSGVLQVNFRLPDRITTGARTIEVVLRVGAFSSSSAKLYIVP